VTRADATTYTFAVPDLSDGALADVTAEIASTAAEYDRTGDIPWPGIEAAQRAGLLTASVGTRYGGPGFGPRQTARILTAIGEGDASVGLIAANLVNIHAGQAAQPSWPAPYYDDLLRRSQTGPALVNAVRAEPELGAPARGGLPKTTATRTAEGWVLNGHKAYATGGNGLAYHVVWAVADEPDGNPDRPRVGHVIVPGDLPGITWVDTWDHLATSASATAANTAKASRHAPSCPNSPPTAGPRTLPAPHIAETSAAPRAHSRSGSARWIRAYPSPASRPPPRPWTARPTSNVVIPGLIAQITVPAVNSRNASTYDVTAPRVVSNRLTSVAVITDATRNDVIVHA
jgi:hypothetical protein